MKNKLKLFVLVCIPLSANAQSRDLISDFTNVFSMEVFLQGFAFTVCITAGLFIILTDQRHYFRNATNFADYVRQLKVLFKQYVNRVSLGIVFDIPKEKAIIDSKAFQTIVIVRTIGLVVAFLILVIIFGVIVNVSSDQWMRLSNSGSHLGLKEIWRDNATKEIEIKIKSNTYDAVKLQTFDKIYQDIAEMHKVDTSYFKNVNELYYQAWHELISKDPWRGYVIPTHNLVDITESFAISFFILFSLAYINFIINIYRDFVPKSRDSARAIFFPSLGFVVIFLVTIFIDFDDYWFIPITAVLATPLCLQVIISLFFDSELNKKDSVNSYYSLTSVLIIYISCGCYLLSSFAYMENTKLLCRKAFGIYRYVDNDLRQMTRQVYPKLIQGYKPIEHAKNIEDNRCLERNNLK